MATRTGTRQPTNRQSRSVAQRGSNQQPAAATQPQPGPEPPPPQQGGYGAPPPPGGGYGPPAGGGGYGGPPPGGGYGPPPGAGYGPPQGVVGYGPPPGGGGYGQPPGGYGYGPPQGGYGYGPPPPGPGGYGGYFGPPPNREPRTRHGPTRAGERTGQQTRQGAADDEQDEDDDDADDDDDDASTEYADTEDLQEDDDDDQSYHEPFPYVDTRHMYRNFNRLEHKEIQQDKRHGMRVQIREKSPVEMKQCKCTPKPRKGILPMIYDSKRCVCGYGTEKMLKDLKRPVRILWSPVDDEPFVDNTVTKFQRARVEKLFLPTLPGTAPPAGYNMKPKRKAGPGTAPGGRMILPEVAQTRFIVEQGRKLPEPRKPPEVDDYKNNISVKNSEKVKKGKYFDAKTGKVMEFKVADVVNEIKGRQREAP